MRPRRQYRMRFNANFPETPEMIVLSDRAFRAYIECAGWVTRYREIDWHSGEEHPLWFIPDCVVQTYGRGAERELVKSGLWVRTSWEDQEGYGIKPREWWKAERIDQRPKIPDRIRLAVYARDGHACVSCGSSDDLSLDHIYPYSMGGPDTEDNLQTMCRPCNSTKGAKVHATN